MSSYEILKIVWDDEEFIDAIVKKLREVIPEVIEGHENSIEVVL